MDKVFSSVQWVISLVISTSILNTTCSVLLAASRMFYSASQEGQLPLTHSMLNEHIFLVVAVIQIIILSSIAIIPSDLIYLIKYMGIVVWFINKST
jgi:L-type amino acid transporter 13